MLVYKEKSSHKLKFADWLFRIVCFTILNLISLDCAINFNQHKPILQIASGVLRKRQENLCPVEYQSCWCDYTNTDVNTNRKVRQKFSILIDCQVTSLDVASSNMHTQQSGSNQTRRQVLTRIPKVEKTNHLKYPHLNHITHLDLSRTDISEVQTDAFVGLAGLQTIVITNCKNLTVIRMFAFRHLPHLKTLMITNNPKLFELEAHAFGSLRNLNFLSLSMNQLSVIDEFIFSASTSIQVIDFIGNPIRKIKSHAFHGLRNVSELLLSLNQNTSPIELIEGDAFISTAFVDQIFLEGIQTRVLNTNTFRGLSYCKKIHLTNTYIERIEANAFFRANNIQVISLINSKIKHIDKNAFSGMFNIDLIDLRGNYISKLPSAAIEPVLDVVDPSNQLMIKESIILVDNDKANKYFIRRFSFEQNPIQCDCEMMWIFKRKLYPTQIALPEICAGPKGYDCLRISRLTVEMFASQCDLNTNEPLKQAGKVGKAPCDDLAFEIKSDSNSQENRDSTYDYEHEYDEYAENEKTVNEEQKNTNKASPIRILDSTTALITKMITTDYQAATERSSTNQLKSLDDDKKKFDQKINYVNDFKNDSSLITNNSDLLASVSSSTSLCASFSSFLFLQTPFFLLFRYIINMYSLCFTLTFWFCSLF